MKKPVLILPFLFLARLASAADPLPGQTFFPDPLRTLFPAGTFNPKGADHPKGWTDLSAFTTHNAKLDNDWLELTNDDPAKTIHIQTTLPVDPDWRWIAASAILVAKDVKPADSPDAFAGLDLTFLDNKHKPVGTAAQLSPLTAGKYVGQKTKLATFSIPPTAAFLQITPTLTLTTGKLAISHIVVMPADPDKEPAPAKVIALHKFIKSGNLGAVQKTITPDKTMLESRNADYDVGTPLIAAAWEGQTEIIQALLDHGADPLATDQNYFCTATYWAAYWGHPAALKILLPLTKDDPKVLQQAVTVGRTRNHKNTPDSDFQACLALLHDLNTPVPATLP